jgi:RNA polymerase primary sigma factor
MKNYKQKSESLERYFKSIKDLNPLAKSEEIELARKAQTGDRRALNKLIEHNLKIVVTIANKNVGRGIDVDDLIQQGNLGLFNAVDKFDPEVGVRFASFAGTRILKMMNQLIDTCGRVVRIPVNQEYKRYLALKKGEEVENLSPVKLDDFVQDDSGRSKADMGIMATRPEIEQEFEMEDFRVRTTSLLSTLQEREREIVKLYFGIDTLEAMPTKDIADEVGLTQIRVCQIINSAKKKLKQVATI